MTTQTHEPNKWLALGERLRENPRTILLSIPVLGAGVLWFGLVEDKNAQAGAFGHLGLTFRLYYKHHWQNKFFLRLAYYLLSQAAELGTGDGQPTVRMVMGGIAADLGNLGQAKNNYDKGVTLAKRINDPIQAAFVESHLGRLEIQNHHLPAAQKHLDHAYKVLSQFATNKTDARPHIWLSNAEIGYGEWYLAAGDKKRAKLWTDKVAARANKYNLKTRRLDAQKLLQKISAVTLLVLSQYPRAMISIGTLINTHLQA